MRTSSEAGAAVRGSARPESGHRDRNLLCKRLSRHVRRRRVDVTAIAADENLLTERYWEERVETAEHKRELGAANEVDDLRRLNKALHDLCQPLTTLQCRLEMAGVLRTPDAYRDAVELGLGECSRLMDAVGAMRNLVREALKRAESA